MGYRARVHSSNRGQTSLNMSVQSPSPHWSTCRRLWKGGLWNLFDKMCRVCNAATFISLKRITVMWTMKTGFSPVTFKLSLIRFGERMLNRLNDTVCGLVKAVTMNCTEKQVKWSTLFIFSWPYSKLNTVTCWNNRNHGHGNEHIDRICLSLLEF